MDLLTQLHQVAEETICAIFSLRINQNGTWKMHIIQSKIVLIGTFEEVATAAIKEFKNNRTPLPLRYKRHPAYLGKKYKYTPPPKTKLKSSEAPKAGNISLFDLKLKFANSLGFSNIATAYGALGKYEFEQKFKKQPKLKITA